MMAHSLRRISAEIGVVSRRFLGTGRSLGTRDKDDDYVEPKRPDPENPFRRAGRILADDFRLLFKERRHRREDEIFPNHCDVAIIGGGVMGSSIAYWLRERVSDALRVVVIERDSTYSRASTPLSVGGVRQQFSLPENIQLSLASSEFFRNIRFHLSVLNMDPPNIQFNPMGYMFLATQDGAKQLNENYELQIELGARVERLTAQMIKNKYPWMNVDGIELGVYGLENEGKFDPWSLLCAFRNKAMALGARYVDGEVVGFTFKKIPEVLLDGQYPMENVNEILVKMGDDGRTEVIKPSLIVVAAGWNSGKVAQMMRIGRGPGSLKTPIPVEPRKRYVYVVHAPKGPGLDCPMIINPGGVYACREGLGGNFLVGKSPDEADEPDTATLDVDYSFFDTQIWPDLAQRAECFEGIKVKSAWAGYYDYNTLDQNAIIGNHPVFKSVIFATGFSGHGIQQSPAVGRAICEFIVDGYFKTIDLRRFSVERILDNEPIYEQNIV